MSLTVALSVVGGTMLAPPVGDAEATVGQGFVVSPADLRYILQQIKIAEAHSAALLSGANPDPVNDPVYCQAMVGNGPDQIANPMLSFGLRTVDGSCNNLQPTQGTYGAADQTFPRLTAPVFDRPAESSTVPGIGPVGPPGPTNYNQTSGVVVDSEPRLISNLISDQTATNPAAVAAAGTPVRTQGNDGVVPCTAPGVPEGCVPQHETLSIPNVTTDVGLSPPFNSLFTIFGQFFDHGLDKITNGGNGSVFVPLRADDPLIAGPDHELGTTDDLPADQRFMVLTRGKIVTGTDGKRNAVNTDTPFVDQSQTYTSHASHQVFTREYALNSEGNPVSTGKFLSSADGGLPTWAMVKAQAASMLGFELTDAHVGNIPMIATDPYGRFLPAVTADPETNGMPQFVTTSGLVPGNRATPVPVPADARFIDTAFLNDIAHSAAPTFSSPGVLNPDADDTAGGSLDHTVPAGSYDDELLDLHAICGDGRCNENIALQAIHQVFHSEHDRLIDDIKQTLTNDTSGTTALADWQSATGAGGWNGERLFQAARFVTEMEYQHLVFEEFARKVQPAINPFEPFAFNQTDVDPAITAEFAHAVYRFGHSMLTDSIPRLNADGSRNDIPLLDGFLNPAAYHDGGSAGTLSSRDAAGAIIMGLSDETGQEIDEFVTETLRNNLLGLPLDLAALNMARARSEGIPPLNQVRRQIHARTNDAQMMPYENWVDVGQGLKHPESLVNFVAAYGRHPLVTAETTIEGRRRAADQIVNGTVLPGTDGELADVPDHVYTACTAPNTPSGCDESVDNVPASILPGDDLALINPDAVVGAPACAPRASTADPFDPIDCDATLDNVVVAASDGPDGIGNDVPDPCSTGANVPAGCEETADNVNPPADAADFMFSTGAWSNSGTASTTGVDDIDLWVGGLAERTNLFGGLLGSTFNYVFENQLTNLQNGDRFYYLARTPGMNLRTQLEGNSFAELIMRNTNAHSLKADPFATADCKFELGRITWPAPSTAAIRGAGSVADDALSECNENKLLLNSPTWQIRYRTSNSVDPSGINGQGVYNGTANADRIFGGVDNDTFWGGPGNDVLEGGDGADIALGGDGDDIITDLAGDDIPKGGPGDDAIDAGPGLDIIMGGEGNDLTNGGANANETFGGGGDDFAIAGQGIDAVFGDSGNDWAQGGDQPDLLIGDSSTLFFDDHNRPGHDILIGQGGDDDYDLEGGDDIGVGGPGVEKNAGASGWDWIVSVGDPQPMDADLALPIVNAPPANETRDRFNEVEALSGWDNDDTIRGDSVVPSQLGGGGFIGCDALDQAGIDRIDGLGQIMPPLDTVTAASVVANSTTNYCLLTGQFVWGEGNILLGGAGSDTIEGRGGDDIIDGDRWLNVRLSVRTDPADPLTEIGTAPLLDTVATGPGWTGNLAGKSIQQAVFAGLVDPGHIVAVREIVNPGAGDDVDVAEFAFPQGEYTITPNGDGSVTVSHITLGGGGGGGVSDGTDTLWNIESLSFCEVPGAVRGTCDVRSPLVSVTPSAVITPDPGTTFDFGTVAVGQSSPTESVTVLNTGLFDLDVSDVSITGPDAADFELFHFCGLVFPDSFCSVFVTFNPSHDGDETATLTITHNAPGSPATFPLRGKGFLFVNTPASGTVSIADTTPAENQVLQASSQIVDPDGIGPITWTWQAETGPGTWTDVGTGATFTPDDPQVGQALRVIATFTDQGLLPALETVTSAATAPVTNVNDLPTGVPVLADALQAAWPQEGSAISASTIGIGDGDGMAGVTFSYLWQQNNIGGNGAYANIAGATGPTFIPGQAQVNRKLRVVVLYADNRGTNEVVVSAPTTNIVGDQFIGAAGNETFNGTVGRDIASGMGGADILNTGAGDDTVIGGTGNDTINTGAGDDVIRVGVGDGSDAVAGGTGTDRIEATANGAVIGLSSIAGIEVITANGFTGVTIAGTGAGDTFDFSAVTLTGIARIDGGGGADTIVGSAVADVVNGGAGTDNLAGGAGADILNGGTGNDTLNGNAGNDVLRFEASSGTDTVNGFDANPAGGGQDLIDLSALGVRAANFATTVTLTRNNNNTIVRVGTATITVVGVRPGNNPDRLDITDFILAP